MLNNRNLLLASAALAGTAIAAPPTNAQEGDNNHISAGAGALFVESPFEGEGTRAFPIPLISIRQDGLYVEGVEAGVELAPSLDKISPSAQIFVAARNTAARDRQKVTADVGIRLKISSDFGELSGEYRHDVTDTFSGGEIIARYALPIEVGRLSITPAVQVSFLDRKTADHMYGVTAAQRAKAIRKKRDVILPVAPITEKATNIGGDISLAYRLTDRLLLIGVLGGTLLDKSIHRSPAIDQKWEAQGILGLAYSF